MSKYGTWYGKGLEEYSKEELKNEIDRLKKEAGEIPKNTCPDIDKIIVGLNDARKNIAYYVKNAHRYESSQELAEAIDGDFEVDFENELEQLRVDNDKLRGLGIYWYEKAVELITEKYAHHG